MPRARLPQLTSITEGSFEPNRKNPITLRDDENLDGHLKPIQIGGNNSAIELATDTLRVSGNLIADRVEGDVNINNGNVNIDEGFKLRFDSESAFEGVTSGNSYIYVEDDTMYFYVGGEKLLALEQEFGFGTTDTFTSFTSNMAIESGYKFSFTGSGGTEYIKYASSHFEFYAGDSEVFSIKDDGIINLVNNEYIDNTTDGTIKFYTDGMAAETGLHFSSNSGSLILPAQTYLRLDGDASGDTHIREVSADQIAITAGGQEIGRFMYGAGAKSLVLPAACSLYFDGGNGTRIHEISDDVLEISVAGDTMIKLSEKGDDGNEIDFGSSCVGFTQLEPTYDGTTTVVDFRHSNKQNLTFGSGSISNLMLYFPLVSGNFQLLVKQDGTGSRTITNYKVREFDETYADGENGVKWAGGSNPTLTTDANHVDILSFYWDADNEIAYGVATLDFQF